jgi:hypothetical protein
MLGRVNILVAIPGSTVGVHPISETFNTKPMLFIGHVLKVFHI